MPAEAAVRFESALRQRYDERGDGQRLAVKLWDGLGHVSDLCPCPPPCVLLLLPVFSSEEEEEGEG